MKRVLSIVLSFACMASVLTGCGGAPTSSGGADSGSGSSPDSSVWPTEKNIAVVVPDSAGAATDNYARVCSQYLQKTTDSNFVIENGTTANVSFEEVRNAPQDGSIFLFTHTRLFLADYFGTYDYNPVKDFDVVTSFEFNQAPQVVAVRADSPYQTLDDLINAAKEAPDTLITGSGFGNVTYCMTGALEKAAGCTFKKVDSADNATRISGLLGKQFDFVILSTTSASQYAESGDMRILATISDERFEGTPDIPCTGELGYPGAQFPVVFFLLAPKGTDPAILDAAAAAFDGMQDDEDSVKAFEKFHMKYEYTAREDALKIMEEHDTFCKELAGK